MRKQNRKRVMGITLICSVVIFFGVLSPVYADDISARLVAIFDGERSIATTMLVGYCKDSPVVIGPGSLAISWKEFSDCTRDNMEKIIPDKNLDIKRVTKFSNNGREIVAELVISRESPQIKVER